MPVFVFISAIIPALNEQSVIASAIHRASSAGADEVIVVDGGSVDQTAQLASSCDCQLVVASPGRASQMNAGAKIALGDVLLFLHADTWLEPGACDQIRAVADGRSMDWGGFRQAIDHPSPVYRWIETGNASRVRWQGLVYGDQGLFVRRVIFEQQNGFPDIELMEDFRLAQQLSGIHKPLLLDGPLHVSARRWQSRGVLRQTCRNWLISTAYRLGVSPTTLVRWY